jgi:hypothetical protein
MACGRIAVLVFASVVSALYEAPQGGCSIPPGYDDPVQRAARVAAVPKPRPKPPPPPPQESEQEVQERLERELYERETMVQLSGLGGDAAEDWDEVERQQQRVRRRTIHPRQQRPCFRVQLLKQQSRDL